MLKDHLSIIHLLTTLQPLLACTEAAFLGVAPALRQLLGNEMRMQGYPSSSDFLAAPDRDVQLSHTLEQLWGLPFPALSRLQIHNLSARGQRHIRYIPFRALIGLAGKHWLKRPATLYEC